MTVKSLTDLVKSSFSEWSEDKVPRLAAALAFYTMLSIAPLVAIILKIVGAIFGDKAANGELQGYVEQWAGPQGAKAIGEMINQAHNQPKSGTIATVISVVVLLMSASGVFGELQDSMNTIWEVKPKPNRGIMGIIKDRFFSITLVLGTAFLLMVSLVISAGLSGISKHVMASQSFIWNAVNFIVSLAVITVLFALIFKYLPDVKTQWRYVWVGAVITAVLFTIGKFGLGWYLGRKGAVSVYGAAGSLVALLIWVYYSAQILFFGAEFTQVYARQHLGHEVPPAENAVPVTEEQRAQQGMPRKRDVDAAAREGRLPKPVVKVTAGVSKTTAVAALVGGYVAGKMMKRPKVVYPAAEVAPWRRSVQGLPTRAHKRWMRERARVIREVAERNAG